MEERFADADEGRSGAEEGSHPSSVGHYLASQRKLRGISLEELATRTRIPGRNLERLESGALDGESDGFSRGLVRIVAEELGLDGASVEEVFQAILSFSRLHQERGEG